MDPVSRWMSPGALETQSSGEPEPDLSRFLAQTLESRGIVHCRWKGLWRAVGEDIDLLVERDACAEFRGLVEGLGFKSVLPSGERQVPGVESYLGFDPVLPRPLHLHVHYRLAVGDYWRTTYHLPIERAMLQSATRGTPFPVPAPPYQLLIYVIRMALRLRGWPLPLSQARWLSGIQGRLDYLEGRSDRDGLEAVLRQDLPSIDLSLFDRCMQALRRESDPAESASIRRDLHRRLRAYARLPSAAALLAAAGEKVLPQPFRPMLFDGRMRPRVGGTIFALVGGDGAGGSTCARELSDWLSRDLPTLHADLCCPPRSLLTFLVEGALKAERLVYRLIDREAPTGSPIELLRLLCTARDRYRLYTQVRRFAAAGGIAICERYPIPQDHLLVAPCIPSVIGPNPNRFARIMRDRESSYYERMLLPDVLLVLRLDPDLAVARKPDEPADYVRTHARMIWDTNWTSTRAKMVDASRPLAEVMAELKSLIWSAL